MIMQNRVQNGESILYTAPADVKGGALVVFPGMVAVASTDIPAGKAGACDAEGVFLLPKDNTTLAQGQAVYVKPDGKTTASVNDGQSTPTAYQRIGVAWAAAVAGDSAVKVKINV
jgi:predicted RecA/RadA family phage recombinase